MRLRSPPEPRFYLAGATARRAHRPSPASVCQRSGVVKKDDVIAMLGASASVHWAVCELINCAIIAAPISCGERTAPRGVKPLCHAKLATAPDGLTRTGLPGVGG